MRLPDEVQQCVVFLGIKRARGAVERIKYGGTGFFLEAPSPLDGARCVFLVTAWHVARHIEHGEFFIRANTLDGGYEELALDAGVDAQWWYHPDPSVDIAVMPFAPPAHWAYKRIPANMIMDNARMVDKGIGVGDELYITGLFKFVTGAQRNLPIVRTGNLAMLPSERVPLDRWRTPNMEAYLIEARSIGGLSGSPVFVQRSIKVHAAESSGRKPLAAGAIFLLGLMHGHWDVPEGKVDAAMEDVADEHKRQINVGIGIVVPAYKILEVIDQPELRERIARATAHLMATHGHILDGGSPPQEVKRQHREEADRIITAEVSAVGSITSDSGKA